MVISQISQLARNDSFDKFILSTFFVSEVVELKSPCLGFMLVTPQAGGGLQCEGFQTCRDNDKQHEDKLVCAGKKRVTEGKASAGESRLCFQPLLILRPPSINRFLISKVFFFL